MKYKSVALFFVSVVVCIAFFELPWYNTWFKAKMVCDNCSISAQSQYMEIEERLTARFGVSYNAFVAIATRIRSSNFRNPVILLPPNGYIHAMKLEDGTIIPEPAVFYYFTGMKSVAATSPNVSQANLVILVRNKKLWLDMVKSKEQCDSFVRVFKKYIN